MESGGKAEEAGWCRVVQVFGGVVPCGLKAGAVAESGAKSVGGESEDFRKRIGRMSGPRFPPGYCPV